MGLNENGYMFLESAEKLEYQRNMAGLSGSHSGEERIEVTDDTIIFEEKSSIGEYVVFKRDKTQFDGIFVSLFKSITISPWASFIPLLQVFTKPRFSSFSKTFILFCNFANFLRKSVVSFLRF